MADRFVLLAVFHHRGIIESMGRLLHPMARYAKFLDKLPFVGCRKLTDREDPHPFELLRRFAPDTEQLIAGFIP
ncbi:hypothetical protein D3C76_1798280 [compost metagenome]